MTYNKQLRTLNLGDQPVKYWEFEDFEAVVDEAIDSLNDDDAAPLFGGLWPSAIPLCEHLLSLDLKGTKVLELGCGLALPSIIASLKGALVTATDFHPSCQSFAEDNAKLNGAKLSFARVDWRQSCQLPSQDLIIASDILYEPQVYEDLAHFIHQLCHSNTALLIADPQRMYSEEFFRILRNKGFRMNQKLQSGDIILRSWRR